MVKPFRQIAASTILVGAAAVAAQFIAPWEGKSAHAYRDGGGIWTICEGHTAGVHEGDVATKAQCDQWYKQDISAAQAVYDAYVLRDNPRNVEAAAISFIFNTGAHKFAHSTLMAKLNTGKRNAICDQFLRWKYQGPLDCSLAQNTHICGGLWSRRQQERALCLDDNYYDRYTVNANNVVTGVKGK